MPGRQDKKGKRRLNKKIMLVCNVCKLENGGNEGDNCPCGEGVLVKKEEKEEVGYGQCKDCIWYKVVEGCNVKRGSTLCSLNYEKNKSNYVKSASIIGPTENYDYPGFHAGDIDFKIGTRCGAFIDDRHRCINFECVPKTRNCCKYLLITGECEFSSNAVASEEDVNENRLCVF
jgi:hypothetical protein